MPNFDGMGPQGQGAANGFGARGCGMGTGQGRGRGQGGRMGQRQAGNGGVGWRQAEVPGRGFFGSCIARLEARIQALQNRLTLMKGQGE